MTTNTKILLEGLQAKHQVDRKKPHIAIVRQMLVPLLYQLGIEVGHQATLLNCHYDSVKDYLSWHELHKSTSPTYNFLLAQCTGALLSVAEELKAEVEKGNVEPQLSPRMVSYFKNKNKGEL